MNHGSKKCFWILTIVWSLVALGIIIFIDSSLALPEILLATPILAATFALNFWLNFADAYRKLGQGRWWLPVLVTLCIMLPAIGLSAWLTFYQKLPWALLGLWPPLLGGVAATSLRAAISGLSVRDK